MPNSSFHVLACAKPCDQNSLADPSFTHRSFADSCRIWCKYPG